MNRRTFLKAAAGAPVLASGAQSTLHAAHSQETMKPWPKTAYFDNPIANGLFPLQFVETLPLLVRARAEHYSFVKDAELFSFTAHEWITDAVLFRGMEIKPKKPSDRCNQALLDVNLSIYVDDSKVSDGFRVGDFMAEGGRAFRRWDRADTTKILYCTSLGWSDKWSCDQDHFLGFFIPGKTCISVKAEGSVDVEVEIKCDMARYTSKK